MTENRGRAVDREIAEKLLEKFAQFDKEEQKDIVLFLEGATYAKKIMSEAASA